MILFKTNFSLNNLRSFLISNFFSLRGRFFLLGRVREVQLACFRYLGGVGVGKKEKDGTH